MRVVVVKVEQFLVEGGRGFSVDYVNLQAVPFAWKVSLGGIPPLRGRATGPIVFCAS